MLKSISKAEVKQKVCTGGLKGCKRGGERSGWLIWRKWRPRWQIGGHDSHESSNSPCVSPPPPTLDMRLHFTSTLRSLLGRRAVAGTWMFGGMSDEAQGFYMDPFSWLEFSPVFGERGRGGGSLRQQTCWGPHCWKRRQDHVLTQIISYSVHLSCNNSHLLTVHTKRHKKGMETIWMTIFNFMARVKLYKFSV